MKYIKKLHIFVSFLFAILPCLLCTKISFGQIQTYYITSNANLPDMGNFCGSYYGWSNNFRITWTDALPAGSTVTAVNVTYDVGIECNSGQWYSTQLNGWGGNFYPQTPNNCSCSGSNTYGPQSMPAGGYIVDGLNTFTIWMSGYDNFGLWPGLTGGSYAIVTVNYIGTPLLTVTGALSDFGSQCINSSSSYQSYTVTGSSLSANVVITPPSGFEVSTDAITWYTSLSPLSIVPAGGNVNATIYVHFKPTLVQVYNPNNITNASTGATTQTVAASGTGINTGPSISSPTASAVTPTQALMGGNITAIGCSNVTQRGVYYSTSSFSPPGGVSHVDQPGSFGTGAFSETVSGLTAGTTYYFCAYATNPGGTVYTAVNTYIYHTGSGGFQNIYTPSNPQFTETGFYINANKMIMGGVAQWDGSIYPNPVIVDDTMGNLLNSWNLSASSGGFGMTKIRKIDGSNSVIPGKGYGSPQNAIISTFNHITGTPGSAFGYNRYIAARFGQGAASDAISLANGDLAFTGNFFEEYNSHSPPSHFLAGGGCPDGYGQFAVNIGTIWYDRAEDIFLIRTGSNGDTATGANGDGFVKEYSLAYCGGGYNPPQPSVFGHSDGNFCWSGNPSLMLDSARKDIGLCLAEVGADIFIGGGTIDLESYCTYPGTYYLHDEEAFILKTNSAGSVQWCRTYYTGPQASAGMEAEAIAAVTSDGSNDIIVAMRCEGAGTIELARVANASGNIVWAESFNFGAYTWPWSIKQTSFNTFIVGVVTENGGIGSYDLILFEITRDGNLVQSKGYGTVNLDGTDVWGFVGSFVDQFGSSSNYAISAITNFSGGSGSAYVVKANKSTNSSGCLSNEYSISPVVTVRSAGGGNQLYSRKPLCYEFRSGANEVSITMTATPTSGIAASPICFSVLPIELMSFNAKCTDHNVNITWSTASETNNDYFTVERSQDGETWEIVAVMPGAGNSNTTLYYSAIDSKPYADNTYYRLKQTDFNGNFKYFDPVAATCNSDVADYFILKPNPANNEVTCSVFASEDNNVTVGIINYLGQKILLQNYNLTKGSNDLKLDVSQFSNGVYTVIVYSAKGDLVKSKQLVIQKR
jgi:Secretion system C-terminal sorting domain